MFKKYPNEEENVTDMSEATLSILPQYLGSHFLQEAIDVVAVEIRFDDVDLRVQEADGVDACRGGPIDACNGVLNILLIIFEGKITRKDQPLGF